MSDIRVSLFASAVRPRMWKEYLESLKSTTVPYEVIFSGFNTPDEVQPFLDEYLELKYIYTRNIKPSQNYALASRFCVGETISWSCDDASYNGDVLGKAYKLWKEKNNYKLILSIQTAESGYGTKIPKLFNMEEHRFYGGEAGGPLMAPICMMSRKFLNDLGGLDCRYIAGQYENDIVMRAYQHGATVEIFGNKDCYVEIDHLRKSKEVGESVTMEDFLNRPFAKGYANDRAVLENSWTTFDQVHAFKLLESGAKITTHASLRKIHTHQLDKHQPFSDDISYTQSEGNNLPDIWD